MALACSSPLAPVVATANRRAPCCLSQQGLVETTLWPSSAPKVEALLRRAAAAAAAGKVTPSEVAERIIAFVEQQQKDVPPNRRFFISFLPHHIRQQAVESTQRWQQGAPASPLDGVPFAVKDCLDALPHPTTAGTAFLASK